ncbi:OmpA family protein [Bacteroides stercoris]|jgi:outer membrane protein OmpA-like peptidoglycan-associated protein|uniref:OmpA family protein n=1 Tax=Bacteroides stercoris TaxID=46506 RepID=A0A3E4US11_BACSE|nr:OmpA family protein [Bacteroides stercoris]RGM15004.1 OmpA family protein [Bacteroides stercoris]RGR29317.1 OmpA family protein [Bacteroides stercoris]RGR38076.1 OmpA family protein [Bacteroides stercoris]
MKSLKYIIAGFCLAALPGMEAMAQEVVKVDDPWKDYPDKKTLYKDYSRWSIGVNIGMPFYAGDFRSVSRGNNNWAGYMFGLQGSYQFNPIFGARLSVDYGSNRAGSQRYEDDFVLLPNGNTYYNVDFPEGGSYYKDLYSSVHSWNFGLNAEVNLLNLFRRSDGDRRWAVVLAPGIYLQKFSSTVKNRSNDEQFADKLDNKVNLGLGGDLAVRYRINHNFDVQLKGGMIWINNQDFDGINSINTTKHNSMITAQVGLIWKVGNSKGRKKDNIMYAPGYLPMWKRATKTVTKVVHDTIYIEQKVLEKSPEVVVCKGFPKDLPAVYFERGKWKLDTDKYARELFTIAKTLKENPEIQIDICGYADHTGGEAINKKVTLKRAEALKKFLVKVGIEPERLHTYGLGKDMTIEKELRYTEKARRGEVKEKDKE